LKYLKNKLVVFSKKNFGLKYFSKKFLEILGAFSLVLNLLFLLNLLDENYFNKLEWKGFFLLIFPIIILSIFFTIIEFSKTQYTFKFKNLDSSIEIEINDFFNIDGNKIIPMNSSFDTNLKRIIESPNSIQYYFQNNYYPDLTCFDNFIEKSIVENNIQEIDNNTNKEGKSKIYSIGTVVPVKDNNKKYNFYLLAHSNVNNDGTIESKTDYIDESLLKLWDYLSEQGTYNNYVIPLIGTGRCRLTVTRNEVIKKIIETFIVGVSSKKFTEKLIICIHPDDLKKIDLENILEFLDYKTKFFEHKRF